MSTISNAVHSYTSDTTLVSDASTGDQSAFEELCRRHSTKLARCIRRILGDRSDAEDVLQDTLVSAFTHLKSFEGRSSVSTWLTRIAINAAFTTLRRKRYTFVSIDDTEDGFREGQGWTLRDGAPDPESQVIQKQKETLVAECIRRLPPRLRSVVELRVSGGYSGKEIAEKLGISESAVKARLWRAQLRIQGRDRVGVNRSDQRELTNRRQLRA